MHQQARVPKIVDKQGSCTHRGMQISKQRRLHSDNGEADLSCLTCVVARRDGRRLRLPQIMVIFFTKTGIEARTPSSAAVDWMDQLRYLKERANPR
jgi:hypothetical protein